jgi:hypothetical protein
MTRFALWSLAIALGLAGWVAIVVGLGWWSAIVLVYLYTLLIAAVASAGGVNAALAWLARWYRQ